ncbi:glycosyltransferase family 4 protein [Peribacillus sp. S4]|uniref:glycosyltransferase family 4 protein n=1 Tax=Peribacillus sp. S4 TaxID=3384451 RepID=UPI0039893B32
MRILHICSYYIGNKLYMNLIKQLSFKGINQEVFIPVKDKNYIGKNQLPQGYNTVNYCYRNILKKYDRFLLYNKVNKQMKEIEKSLLINREIDFVHAHTLFSDGGTAYKLYKKYGINYIVNVRNTDINVFYKYGLHLRPFIQKVLLNARAVVFISHAYKEKMLTLLPSNVVSKIQSKCYVIPNGIDDHWHENAVTKSKKGNLNDINLLFIGSIDKNKNLSTVISACSKLQKEGYKVSLNVIGSGPLEDECRQLNKKLGIEKDIIFHGYLQSKEHISSIMDKCDIFVMPSFIETFGLVYIEAMSSGLPVIYSKGQGIDGFFNEGEVGFSVDPNNHESIVESIEKIMMRYNEISVNCYKNSREFNWDDISKKYLDFYTY